MAKLRHIVKVTDQVMINALAQRLQRGRDPATGQAQLLWALLKSLDGKAGPAPSMAQLAAACGVRRNVAHRTLLTLEQRGIVTRELRVNVDAIPKPTPPADGPSGVANRRKTNG